MEAYRNTRSLQSFSPTWTDPELLEKTLVGRKDLVDRLEELAIDGTGGPNKHQRLIVGVRGSGKTHVLRVLHDRLWRNEELKKRLCIIYLLEDELGVASLLDFVVRLLRAVVRWYPEQEQLARDLEAIYDLPLDLQEHRAVQLLLEGAGDKDILILLENLGIIFDERKGFGHQGQQALRDLIQKDPKFMIFASSQALVQGTRAPDAPFYGFFKVIHLRRLTVDEAMHFLQTMASATEKEEVDRFLKTAKGRARMRAIYDFTGGNHRLLVNFFEFLTADSLVRLSELFVQALDPLKPYYQEQMRSLSAQQQKIVQYLALEGQPRTVKDIARACFAAPNTTSSQLKELFDRKFVTRVEQGRETYYEITEALFRICYEADLEQEGAPVRLFVDFLATLYTAQELQLRYRGATRHATRDRAEGIAGTTGSGGAWLTQPEPQEPNGEARRMLGQYERAIAEYEAALQADPDAALPQFNIVSALLGLGNIHEALDRLAKAVDADRKSETPKRGYVVECFHESCQELLEHASTHAFALYLERALEVIEDAGYLEQFEQSIPLTVFALLKDHEKIGEERFAHIVRSVRDVIGKRIEVSVAVRFLQVGIDYFKNQDRKALLRLTREERRTFCDQLGIENR